MRIEWTDKATADLVRLHGFLKQVAPDSAVRIVQDLSRAPDKLLDFPRIGEKLEGYEPRDVHRIIVGKYELRYELAEGRIVVLRLWHGREDRALGESE